MATFNVHEAKTHLSRLLQQVEAGEEVVIARDGKPIARLVSLSKGSARVPGRLKGQIKVAEDFDEPLPDEYWLDDG